MTQEELDQILEDHELWLKDRSKGKRANLSYLDLKGANFSNRDLPYCDFLNSHLSYCDLSNRDLSYCNFLNCDLTGTNLTDAKLPKSLDFTFDPDLKAKILNKIEEGCELDMRAWRTCETTHWLDGWAVVLHPEGKRLEENSSTYLAGRLLLGLDHEEAEIFFSNEEEVMKFLKGE